MKDTNNLLDYNIWSGTDYNKNITGFLYKPISSNEWSYVGENSLKLTKISDVYNDYTSEHEITCPSNNYKLTVKVYSPEGNGRIMLLYGTSDYIYLYFSPRDYTQSLTLQVENTTIRGIRFSSDTFYASINIDDINLFVVP